MNANLNLQPLAHNQLTPFHNFAANTPNHLLTRQIIFQGQGPARTIQIVQAAAATSILREEIVNEFNGALQAAYGHSITSFIFPDRFSCNLGHQYEAREEGLSGRKIAEALNTASQVLGDMQEIRNQMATIRALKQEITGHALPALEHLDPFTMPNINVNDFLHQVEEVASMAQDIVATARDLAANTSIGRILGGLLNRAEQATTALEAIQSRVSQIVNLRNSHVLIGASADNREQSINYMNAITNYTNGAIENYNFIDARLNPQSNERTPSPSGSES